MLIVPPRKYPETSHQETSLNNSPQSGNPIKATGQNLVLLALTYFFYFGYFGVTVPFLGVFLDGRGFSSQQIGELIAVITFVRILGPNLWAIIADKTGKTLRVMQAGCLITLLSYLLLFEVQNFWGISLAFGLVMMFWTAIAPQMETITLNSVHGDAKTYSNIRLWGSVGFIVASIVAGVLVDANGPESILLLNTIILSSLFLMSLIIKDTNKLVNSLSPQRSIWQAALHPAFALFILASIALQLSFAPYYGFFALYMRDIGYDAQQIGWLVSLGVAAEVIIFLLAGKLINRMGVKYTLIFCLIVTALRWAALAEYAQYPWILLLSQCIHAFSFGLAHAAAMQFIHHHFGDNQKSRGQAIYVSVSFGLGGSIGSYLAGFLWQQGEGAQLTFFLAGGASLAGALLMALVKSADMRKQP